MTLQRLSAGISLAVLCILTASCGGSSSSGPDNPWTGTRTTIYFLRGDMPTEYQGPDGFDELIQAQIKQALFGRVIELDLYEIENSSGAVQQLRLHSANVLSYLQAGGTPAYQLPGVISGGQGVVRIELQAVGPTFAWESLVMRTALDGNAIEAGVQRIHPYRDVNPVSGTPFFITWDIQGVNGNRPITVECKQIFWLYAETRVVP